MGIKLMVEIMDHWQDVGLTAGERNDLLVIAENASDGSRETFPKVGMHQEYILKRVGKNAAAWKNAIGKLMKKGALTYAVKNGREITGHPGQVAVYRIPVLCLDAPHDGLWGQCTRSERVTPEVTQSQIAVEPSAVMGHLRGDPNSAMGHLSDAERVTSQVTPSPPFPSGTTSSTPAGPLAAPDTKGGGGGVGQQEQDQAAAFLQNLPGRWAAGKATAERLAPPLLEAVVRQGWDLDTLLAAKLTEDLGPVRSYPGTLAFRISDLPKRPTTNVRASPAEQPITVIDDSFGRDNECAGCDRPIRPGPPGALCRDCREEQQQAG